MAKKRKTGAAEDGIPVRAAAKKSSKHPLPALLRPDMEQNKEKKKE